jgi:hypothetical protein
MGLHWVLVVIWTNMYSPLAPLPTTVAMFDSREESLRPLVDLARARARAQGTAVVKDAENVDPRVATADRVALQEQIDAHGVLLSLHVNLQVSE